MFVLCNGNRYSAKVGHKTTIDLSDVFCFDSSEILCLFMVPFFCSALRKNSEYTSVRFIRGVYRRAILSTLFPPIHKKVCNDFSWLWFDQIIDNKHFVSSQPFLILLSLHACLPVRAVSERIVCEQNCKKKRILEKRIEISWNACYHYYDQTITFKINTCLLCLILNLFTWKSMRQVSLPENKQKRETIWSFWLFD